MSKQKKTKKYVKHVMFSVQSAMFKVSEICFRSGKSQRSCRYHFGYFSLYIFFSLYYFNKRLNKKTEKYVKHVMFSVQIVMLGQ